MLTSVIVSARRILTSHRTLHPPAEPESGYMMQYSHQPPSETPLASETVAFLLNFSIQLMPTPQKQLG